jgi:hypothetical protein
MRRFDFLNPSQSAPTPAVSGREGSIAKPIVEHDAPRLRSFGSSPAMTVVSVAAARLPPMVIVSRNGRVNRIPPFAGKPRQTWVFAISRDRGGAGVHLRFIPIFKLPFKFDRS